MITYQLEPDLSVEEFRTVLIQSTLGNRRPVEEPDRLAGMLRHSNLIFTARDNGILVGVSRSLTDFVYCTYLSDLAVINTHQRKGIGKELIRQTKLQTPQARLILLAAPAAIPYYPKIGMQQYEYAFMLDDADKLT